MAEATNRHLTLVQRCKIEAYLSSGCSQRGIANRLGVSPSTISRELKRNGIPEVGYEAQLAHRTAVARRRLASARPRKVTPRHLNYIHERMIHDWSPDVIAHKTADPSLKLSTPWIYELIDRDVQAGDDDWTTMLLRKYRKRRGPQKGGGAAHLIPDRVDIDQRPADIETRETFGHWEGDTIIGTEHRGAIVTLVERPTRLIKCRSVQRYTKRAVANAIEVMMQPYADTVKTITFDNGGEFADHGHIAKQLKCDIYFAKPYHAWQRGTNENLNGELRRYYPKHEPLDRVERDELAKVEDQIDRRYRKLLNYNNAADRFAHERTIQRE
ncbi:MAG: IS30 family transposase [Gammaproteobacteria bacterium]|nr:IS30 family transposase [Gammaproteobacteria bacterium]